MSSSSSSQQRRVVVCGTGSNFYGQLGMGLVLPRAAPPHLPVLLGADEADRDLLEQCIDVQCGSQFTAVLDANGQTHFCGSLNGRIYPKLVRANFQFPLRCVQLACGRKHLMALADNGCVFSWGTGYFGQLGHGDDSSIDSPRLVAALEPTRLGARVVRIACGASHSGAIVDNQMIFMWGLNRNGQVGVDVKYESVPSPSPIDLSELPEGAFVAVDLKCGRGHSTALTGDGRLFTWGATSFGRLGFMDGRRKTVKATEVQFFRGRPVKTFAVGDFHSVALCRSGELYSWGYGIEGQCGLGTATLIKTPRQIDYLSPELGVREVACGAAWSMAVTEGGRLYAWGYGDGGWLCMPPPVPPYLEAAQLDDAAPYVDSTTDEPSTETGMLHTRAFDSQHNVMLPCAAHIPPLERSSSSSTTTSTTADAELEFADAKDGPAYVEEAFVVGVRCGAAHSVLLLAPKRRRRLERRPVLSSEAVDSRHAVKAVHRGDASGGMMSLTGRVGKQQQQYQAGGSAYAYVDEEDRHLHTSMVSMGAWRHVSSTTSSSSSSSSAIAGAVGGRAVLPPPNVPHAHHGGVIGSIGSSASASTSTSAVYMGPPGISSSISSSSSSSYAYSASGSASAGAGASASVPAATTSGSGGSFHAPPLETLSEEQLMSAVFSWCRHRKIPELTYAFMKRKLPVNMIDAAGNTPLIVACQNGHLAVCQLLVEQLGADVNCRNAKGNTALHFSFAYGFGDSIGRYLVSRGADEFALNEDGLTCYEGLSSADLESL